MNKFLLSLFMLPGFITFGQTFTLSGYITDISNGENLIGTTIYSKETTKGAVTNAYGFYSLTLPQGKHSLVISYVGYQATDTVIS